MFEIILVIISIIVTFFSIITSIVSIAIDIKNNRQQKSNRPTKD